jgi:hypothetical protein
LVSLKDTIDLLIYLSVVLGAVLLYQLYCLVPQWLFSSVLVGWLAYLAVAVLVAAWRRIAYPLAFVLSILTLATSLPRPEHFAFVKAGVSLASITFLTGSALQIALIILIPIYLLRKKSRAHRT